MAIGRVFTGTVYPDSTSYSCSDVLFKILTQPDSCYILHDKDDVKPHYHWLFRLSQPTTPHKIAVLLGLNDNDIEIGKSFTSLVRYLIHFDDPDKFQYAREDIQTELNLDKYFDVSSSIKDSDSLLDIIDYLEKNAPSRRQMLHWCLSNGVYDVYKRNYNIINDAFFKIIS